MKKTASDTDQTMMTRRKALRRLGSVALFAYSVPALTTLSVAHASSGASNASNASEASDPSDPSDPSDASNASNASSSSGPSSSNGSNPAFDACGEENLADPNYVQCLSDNGF